MDKRYTQLWTGLLLAGCSWMAVAGANLASIRKQAEASLLATGTINVEPDGSVSSFTLDQPAKLPPAVVSLVDTSARRWRFEPVVQDGKPIKAKAKMRLHFIAHKTDDTHYQVSLDAAGFGEGRDNSHSANDHASGEIDTLRAAHRLASPVYPYEALTSGVSGIAYVVVRVNRQGKVADAIVEQVNLRAVANEVEMARFRTAFAQSALRVAKGWTFITPTSGEEANAEFWTGQIPIDYRFDGDTVKYGKWEAYIPGPHQNPPWSHDHDLDDWSLPDTLTAGEIHQAGTGLHLLTPLSSHG